MPGPFSLSTLPFYREARTPEEAELWAQAYARVLGRPELQDSWTQLKIDPQGLLDAPLTSRGWALQQEWEKEQERWYSPFSRGAAQAVDAFGAAGGLQNAITGQWGAPTDIEQAPPDKMREVLGYQVEPLAFLANVGSQLGLYATVGRLTGAAAAPIASPLLRGATAYGTLFGGMEVARQAGRKIGEGDAINPLGILSETIIGGFAGLPLGTGVLGRLKQAALTGGAAGLLSQIPGTDVDPSRIATEALFAALFPMHELPGKVFDVPLDQAELLFKEAQQAAGAPAARIRELTKSRLALLGDDELRQAFQKGGDVEQAVLDQLFRNPAELNSQMLRARAKALKELAQLPEGDLRLIISQRPDSVEAVFASDALAYKLKATKPHDAPPSADVPPLKTKLADFESPEALQAAARHEAISVLRERLNQRGHQAWQRERMAEVQRELELKAAKTQSTQQVADEIVNPKLEPVPPRQRPRFEPTFADSARGILYPEYDKVVGWMQRQADLLEDQIAANPKMPKKEKMGIERAVRDYRKAVEDIKAEQADLLDVSKPVVIKPEYAEQVTERYISGLTRNQYNKFSKELPAELTAHEERIKHLLGLKKRPEVGPNHLERAMEEMKKEGFLKSGAGDMILRRELSSKNPGFGKLQVVARMMGGELHGNKSGEIVFALRGKTARFKTMKEAYEYMRDFQHGIAHDPITLNEAAAARGISVKHTGDGEHVLIDHQADVDPIKASSPQEAMRIINKAPLKEPAAPELVSDVVEIPGAKMSGNNYGNPGRTNVVELWDDDIGSWFSTAQKKKMAKKRGVKVPETADEAIEGLPPKMQTLVKTTKDSFIEIEEWLGDRVPLYSKLFEPMTKLQNLRTTWTYPHAKKLAKILRKVQPNRRNVVQDLLLASRDQSKFNMMAAYHRATAAEIRTVEALKDWYRTTFDWSPEGLNEFIGGMKAFREVGGDPARVLGNHMLPRTMEQWRYSIERGKFRPGSDYADEVAYGALHEAANNKFRINTLLDRGAAMRKELEQVTRNMTGDYKGRVDEQIAVLQRYLNVTGDRADLQMEKLGEGLNKFLVSTAKKWGRVMGNERKYVKGEQLTKADLDRWATMWTTWYSGISMSARAALVVRNTFQSLLAAPKVGYGNVIGAYKDVLGNWKEVLESAKKAGIVTDADGIMYFRELDLLDEGVARRMMKLGLVPYRKADTFNRLVSYQAARRAIKANAHLLDKGDVRGFLLNTGLAGDPDFIRNAVISKLRNRGLDSAADYYGRHVAQDTQWIYQRNNLPEAWQGTWGKIFGQFGVWPINFAGYLKRNVGDTLAWNKRGDVGGDYARKFIMRYSIMLAGLAAGGLGTGIETGSWNASNPLSFEGGPAFQALKNMLGVLFGRTDFEKELAMSNLKRFTSEALIPFGGLIHDIEQANDESEDMRALLTGLGFNLKKED